MPPVRAGHSEDIHAEVASVLDWWTVAGVDAAIAETPGSMDVSANRGARATLHGKVATPPEPVVCPTIAGLFV